MTFGTKFKKKKLVARLENSTVLESKPIFQERLMQILGIITVLLLVQLFRKNISVIKFE